MRTQVQHLGTVTRKREVDMRVYKHDALEGSHDIVQFRGIRLEELPPCRHVEEEVLYQEIASLLTGDRLLVEHLAS